MELLNQKDEYRKKDWNESKKRSMRQKEGRREEKYNSDSDGTRRSI